MKASQIVAPKKVQIIEVEEPRLESEGLIKVRVELACLCGSDVPYFIRDLNGLNELPASERSLLTPYIDYNRPEIYPLNPGCSLHECVGTVVESTGSRFQEGDFVIALPQSQTGYQEFFTVSENSAVHLPRKGVAKENILMTQPLATVVCAVRKLGNLVGQTAVVVGSGPMGLMIIHMLSNLGAKTVIALDKLEPRLEAAKKMRATDTINVHRVDAVAAIEEITSGNFADLVVEVVGHQTQTIRDCFNYVRDYGTILSFGVPDSFYYDRFPMYDFFRKNLTMISSVRPDIIPDYSLARDLIVQKRIDVSPLLTHTFAFDESQQAYETFSTQKDGVIKALIDFEPEEK